MKRVPPALLAALLVLPTGCTYTYVDFPATAVRAHLSELRARSHARVPDSQGKPRRISLDDKVSVNLPGVGPTTVKRLARDCDGTDADATPLPGGSVPRCDLANNATISRRQVDVGATALTWGGVTLTVGAAAGAGYCFARCNRDAKTATVVVLGSVGAAALLVTIAVLAYGHGGAD